jgi:transcriptional regulator with XRE-family HTH domain
MAALGHKLAEARNKREWTLREVERRTGIHNAHLSQIETGGIERPAPNVLWTLAELYELDYRELLRLAGHVETAPADEAAKRSPVGAALRAMGDLTPEEQLEVLEFIEELKEGKHPEHE